MRAASDCDGAEAELAEGDAAIGTGVVLGLVESEGVVELERDFVLEVIVEVLEALDADVVVVSVLDAMLDEDAEGDWEEDCLIELLLENVVDEELCFDLSPELGSTRDDCKVACILGCAPGIPLQIS